MTWRDCFGNAWRRLYEVPVRTVLAIAGVAIGAGTLIFLTSAARSVFAAASRVVSGGGQDFVLISALPRDPLTRPERRRFGSREVEYLQRQLRNRARVAPTLRFGGIARVAARRAPAAIVGAVPELQVADNWRVIAGRFVADLDVAQRHAVCVITEDLQRTLGARVGSSLTIGPYVYSVVGIVTKRRCQTLAQTGTVL